MTEEDRSQHDKNTSYERTGEDRQRYRRGKTTEHNRSPHSGNREQKKEQKKKNGEKQQRKNNEETEMWILNTESETEHELEPNDKIEPNDEEEYETNDKSTQDNEANKAIINGKEYNINKEVKPSN